jgi:hypothetical protein
MWQEGLMSYDEMRGLGWEWQSVDGSMVKAPLTREAVGRLCQNSLAHLYIVVFAFLYGITLLYIAVSFRIFEF